MEDIVRILFLQKQKLPGKVTDLGRLHSSWLILTLHWPRRAGTHSPSTLILTYLWFVQALGAGCRWFYEKFWGVFWGYDTAQRHVFSSEAHGIGSSFAQRHSYPKCFKILKARGSESAQSLRCMEFYFISHNMSCFTLSGFSSCTCLLCRLTCDLCALSYGHISHLCFLSRFLTAGLNIVAQIQVWHYFRIGLYLV